MGPGGGGAKDAAPNGALQIAAPLPLPRILHDGAVAKGELASFQPRRGRIRRDAGTFYQPDHGSKAGLSAQVRRWRRKVLWLMIAARLCRLRLHIARFLVLY